MTGEDIEFIERELDIKLPESYKRALVPFRIPAMYGNTYHQLWDNAEALVRLNREFRQGSRYNPPWPNYMYAVGDPRGDEIIAIDTRDPEGPVWWLDHGVIDHEGSDKTNDRFADWVEQFYNDTRNDLIGDGHDPDKVGPPRLR